MINFKYHSGIYTLTSELEVPISLENAWDFFTSPENLQKITPPHMGFEITSSNLSKVYAGQIITYKVSPFPGIRTNWVTEITQVVDQSFFIDEQRFGPYKMWHHEHYFKKSSNGVIMLDRVSYKVPFWILGNLAHRLFIRKQLTDIFNYRSKVLKEIFN